jgi:hypothetical protein
MYYSIKQSSTIDGWFKNKTLGFSVIWKRLVRDKSAELVALFEYEFRNFTLQ